MNKQKDFQLLVNVAKKINIFSSNDKFNFDKISDYLMLDIYDDYTIREYIKLCDDVQKNGGIEQKIKPIRGFGKSSQTGIFIIHSKNSDLLFLKKCLVLEFRNRILNKIVK
jgi:hypothetical protein